MGRRGIEPSIRSGDEQVFRGTINYVGIQASGYWDCYPEIDTSKQDVGEGR
jgi:hypothetical protein